MKMKPPSNATNVTYGGAIVTPEGVDVPTFAVASMKAAGWVEIKPPKLKKLSSKDESK